MSFYKIKIISLYMHCQKKIFNVNKKIYFPSKNIFFLI